MKVLIIGVDSLIGKSMSRYLKDDDIIGTTRQKNRKYKSRIYFDLNKDEPQWPDFPDDIDCALITASMTSQQQCAENPDAAQHINVTQTIKLIKHLINKNIHVVFPSTNIVLACKAPMQNIDSPVNPIGAYATGKADVEAAFTDNPKVTIARLPKILDSHSGIIQKWSDDLIKGKTIEAYSNLKISPVSLDYVSHFLAKLIHQKYNGIWHISGSSEPSYYDIAYALCDKLNVSRNNIIEQEMRIQSGIANPIHPSLDCSITQNKLGISAQPISNLLDDIVKKIKMRS